MITFITPSWKIEPKQKDCEAPLYILYTCNQCVPSQLSLPPPLPNIQSLDKVTHLIKSVKKKKRKILLVWFQPHCNDGEHM